ncbi:group II intron reverse transcriptase/maturase [Wolbachia endosymbiont of Ctenocephalides felis wCfeT]|uniref:group II intron reverse transcriptase/maturase n=1 Tax=Wolbachia endosymbiont of Ctenocephalides felis wCfeT TaxID=2732593 RepID=UPI001447EBB4|nr:group II intron reverse transcriptase/maturase [Wolbachia endosymbiont of Ctenocephalides felis wCfeT]
MVTGKIVSAPFGTAEHWNQINWSRCKKNTKRLQSRIVQATKDGRWNKVKALQRLLTRSFSAKALAVKRVTSNKGKYTSGVDRQLWQTPSAKSQGIKNLRQHGYSPQPLKRINIPKPTGGKRPLSIPTIKDRAMQALYLMGLDPVAETIGDIHSYGFRKHRSAADAVSQVFLTLARHDAPQWILEADIKKCFDEIDHHWLESTIPIEKGILKKWLKSGFIEKQMFHSTIAGTPQGGIISPVLANLTLDGLEDVFIKHFGKKGTKKRKASGVHLIRYADDFIVTGKSKEILETKVKRLVEVFLGYRGLTLSAGKTKITHIKHGFDFLGQTARKYRTKLIIKPSVKSISRLLKSVRCLVRKSGAQTQEKVIEVLSPHIRGWAYYHRGICARKAYEKVDHEIFKALWQWSKRRHPNKGKRWIKRKYFKVIETRKWCFAALTKDKDTNKWKELFQATSVSIRRHKKVRAVANPYDKEWYAYFKERQSKNFSLCRNGVI